MSMFAIPSFLRTQICTIEDLIGESSISPIYGEPSSHNVRFEPLNRKVTNANGEVVEITGRMFVNEIRDYPVGSRVIFEGKNYYIWSAQKQRAIADYSHVEILLRCR